ncbi:hypothetical protein E2C01_022331 [Portunus trituberculatus]|uniref:Uncharacterized protein n=1 Tax=Portunus trituberculatus TaxID=210409 RepID=A0A5B7E523_PORTR|nr:hypothetical protein [Portunus trituberculatus]
MCTSTWRYLTLDALTSCRAAFRARRKHVPAMTCPQGRHGQMAECRPRRQYPGRFHHSGKIREYEARVGRSNKSSEGRC